MSPRDTIFAPATPSGRSGIAVIRVSGGGCGSLWEAFGIRPPAPRLATLVPLRHPRTGETVDRALVLFFPAPHSFSGEDIVEFHLHGSRAVIAEMLGLLGELEGCRLAKPGEFARRAFENGKLDLAQAEGLADLIDAETSAQKRQALRQMEGRLSDVVETLRRLLLQGLAYLEACLDFPDEEIPPETGSLIDRILREAKDEIGRWLATARQGESVREGYRITLLGLPNAGKSTLLNLLAGRDAAIVSAEAGTTRDPIEIAIDLEGQRCFLTDTAGLRETDQAIEREGIRRALEHAAHADLRMLLIDATLPLSQQKSLLDRRQEGDIVLLNKIDCKTAHATELPEAIRLSALQGQGLESIYRALREKLCVFSGSDAILTRARHREAFEVARSDLGQALMEGALEIKSARVRHAISALSSLIGELDIEALLDKIFSDFCLGK